MGLPFNEDDSTRDGRCRALAPERPSRATKLLLARRSLIERGGDRRSGAATRKEEIYPPPGENRGIDHVTSGDPTAPYVYKTLETDIHASRVCGHGHTPPSHIPRSVGGGFGEVRRDVCVPFTGEVLRTTFHNSPVDAESMPRCAPANPRV